jgi:ABC-2 type transport system permease protein
MAKYWHLFNVGIQNSLAYRLNFFSRACFGLIPLTATILLWRAVYASREGGGTVAGYALAQMISYYLIVTVVDALTAVAEDDWQIVADIKDGRISQFLVKPIDFLKYRLSLFFAGRAVYAAAALVPVSLFIAFHHEYFVLPADAKTFCLFAVSLVMTALLQFFISYTMALLAFWVIEVSTFIFILYAIEYIAGGHLFPIDILPPVVAEVLALTPFPYQMFFPVSIYLGQTTGC